MKPGDVPISSVAWRGAVRIIRSIYPPIDLFDDIADPADWPLLISSEMKTNPRLMETIGNLDLVPPERRVAGPGAIWLMAPFTHISPDRPSRFTNGGFGVLYAAEDFETALFESVYHHGCFMARTAEPEGWTSQFREIMLNIKAPLHDLRKDDGYAPLLHPDDYSAAQTFAAALRVAGSNGIVYPSVRNRGSDCAGLFFPDCAFAPVQGRHIDYHWNGSRVDIYRDASNGKLYRIMEQDTA